MAHRASAASVYQRVHGASQDFCQIVHVRHEAVNGIFFSLTRTAVAGVLIEWRNE